jgi:predicted Zn-dependent protease
MSPTGELDAARVIPRFVQELPTDSLIFNFLIIPYDLRSGNVRHTFGTVYGLPYNSGVVSLAYLTVPANAASKGEAAQIVMQRTYKIILRYIAHTAGLWERNGCVLAWPHGVAALDSKPSDFCDDDKARLIESRILKSQPGGACTPIALHTPIRPVEATASR